MALRRAAVAGTWYPASATSLTETVSGYLAAADVGGSASAPAPGALVALVAPHAGLVYSGPVAAFAYRWLDSVCDTVVLVGPSHYVGFEGASLWSAGAFDTPLGPLAVNAEVASALRERCTVLTERLDAHKREHSLEMQLPFVATRAPRASIVPIVMGYQTRATSFALGDALAEVLEGRRAVLVASSDLSHFYSADVAAGLDARVAERVAALDADGLMSLLEARPDHACGGGPMVAVLHAARRLGATHASVEHYADSGDVSGDKSSVVGYLAAGVWRR